MPAGNVPRNPPAETPHSPPPTSKATQIRNKDGTKRITVPPRKVSNPESVAAQPSTMDYSHSANSTSTTGKKNRKKKKRGTQSQQHYDVVDDNSVLSPRSGQFGHGNANGPTSPRDARQYQQDIHRTLAEYYVDDDEPPEVEDPEDDEDEYYSDQEYEGDITYSHPSPMGLTSAPAGGKKKNKRKKKKGVVNGQDSSSAAATQVGQRGKSKDRIWNTSTAEERERIKDFWLSLGEAERRSLVKVEKDAVLRKMKEQQKHSCSCSVCGRKRTAIEEELEVLYDAYYEELEQYANQQQGSSKPSYNDRGTFLSQVPPRSSLPATVVPPEGVDGDEDYDDEDYDEDDLDDEEGNVSAQHPPPDDAKPDFFNFGNSLTVQGGILTVADDLLKNDGKKFIEMMEQLAERRMQREEEATQAANGHAGNMGLHPQQVHAAHNHSRGGFDADEEEEEEDYEEDEDDEDYDDEEEEDEPDTMTEEQRMEEGRRMFQIFAARMFEQRVLTAYREKVAKERQQKLLEEIEEDNRRVQERELRKAKEKDKKKERKRLQRLAKEEERLKKEAEKAQEEARQKEIEQQKAEEQRKRKEEQRLKKEAERKAQEDERQRKEEEKRKRLQEEKEREAERERKRKEHQERERKKKEEEKRKKQEEKEAREREAKERREREEQQRREQEARAREAAQEKERKRKEEEAKAKAEAAAAKRAAVPPPANVQPPTGPAGYSSPHLSVVTPAIPKQPLGASPARQRNTSQQGSIHGSVGSSPKTPHVAPPTASPSTPILQQNTPSSIAPSNKAFQFPPNTMPPTSPLPHGIAPPPGVAAPEGFANLSPLGMNGMVHPFATMPSRPSIGNGVMFAPPPQMPAPQPYRGFAAASNGMPMQVPLNQSMRAVPQGRGFMGDMPQFPPGVPIPPSSSPFTGRAEPVLNATHSRTPSGSFEPFGHRPNPIQRPASVAPINPIKNMDDQQNTVDEPMGSRALLDPEEQPFQENISPSRRASGVAPLAPRPIRAPVPSPFGDTLGGAFGGTELYGGPSWTNPAPLGSFSNSLPKNTWGGSGVAFSDQYRPIGNGFVNRPAWNDTDAARSTFNRRRVGRLDQVRILVCEQCRELGGSGNQAVEMSTLHRAVEKNAPPELREISLQEINEAVEVEGDSQNGSGNFTKTKDTNGRVLVQYESDGSRDPLSHAPSRLGEIGSPSMGGASLFRTPFAPPGMASPAGF